MRAIVLHLILLSRKLHFKHWCAWEGTCSCVLVSLLNRTLDCVDGTPALIANLKQCKLTDIADSADDVAT